jgi:formate hydrogenlyase subunit 6/NADH:ubiquinone oxidoreductase subunit I
MTRPGKMIRQVLASIFKKPATVMYPKVNMDMPDKFRGEIKFTQSLCIGCKMCMRDCPAGAINIIKVGDKLFEAEIDLGRCIYCAQCVDSCPKKALEATKTMELASLERGKLKVRFRGGSGQAPGEKA